MGPYIVLKPINQINPECYKFPASLHIPNIFHVSLLKALTYSQPFFFRSAAADSESLPDLDAEFALKGILDVKRSRCKWFYLVDWKGSGH